ncbi:hypothetical protein [Candidatus Methylomicrobium oryzae]|nr:hypothetical protein [Methylomicrobium sp. RS1]MBL1264110.1 hypothetical protein [Methylomicrobium sp. RS1]
MNNDRFSSGHHQTELLETPAEKEMARSGFDSKYPPVKPGDIYFYVL